MISSSDYERGSIGVTLAPKHRRARFAFQRCAILWSRKIVLPQKRLPREARHFMRETLLVLSLPASDK